MDRQFQPTLLWAYIYQYADKLWPDEDGTRGSNDIQCFIYLKDKCGAYFLYGPKLYFMENVSSGFWEKCDQNELWTKRDELGEIVIHNKNSRVRKQILLGKTFDESWKKLCDQ